MFWNRIWGFFPNHQPVVKTEDAVEFFKKLQSNYIADPYTQSSKDLLPKIRPKYYAIVLHRLGTQPVIYSNSLNLLKIYAKECLRTPIECGEYRFESV